MHTVNRRIWRTVFGATAANLILLVGLDLLIRKGRLPQQWPLRGAGLVLVLLLALWTGGFVWLVTHPFSAGLRMVLREKVNRIDYVLLVGIALVSISYWALVYDFILRIDPAGLELTGATSTPADLLYVSTLTFLSMGLDIMTPTNWWPRLAMLAETVMGLGYLAGILALLTNRLASEPEVGKQQDAPGPDLPTGTAWAGGGATGAAVGSVAGPVGTAVGAVVGGLLADEAVEHLPQGLMPVQEALAEEQGEAQGDQH